MITGKWFSQKPPFSVCLGQDRIFIPPIRFLNIYCSPITGEGNTLNPFPPLRIERQRALEGRVSLNNLYATKIYDKWTFCVRRAFVIGLIVLQKPWPNYTLKANFWEKQFRFTIGVALASHTALGVVTGYHKIHDIWNQLSRLARTWHFLNQGFLEWQVDDKYQYSKENWDHRVHGWISGNPMVGFWIITPSDEFRNGGPTKQNLTSHVGPTCLSVSFTFYSIQHFLLFFVWVHAITSWDITYMQVEVGSISMWDLIICPLI